MSIEDIPFEPNTYKTIDVFVNQARNIPATSENLEQLRKDELVEQLKWATQTVQRNSNTDGNSIQQSLIIVELLRQLNQ